MVKSRRIAVVTDSPASTCDESYTCKSVHIGVLSHESLDFVAISKTSASRAKNCRKEQVVDASSQIRALFGNLGCAEM